MGDENYTVDLFLEISHQQPKEKDMTYYQLTQQQQSEPAVKEVENNFVSDFSSASDETKQILRKQIYVKA